MNYKDKGSLLKKPPVSLLLCGLCDHSPPDHCEQKPSSLALLFMLAPPTWHPIQFLVPCWPALLCQALELYPVWCPGRPGTSSFSERWFTHLGQRILSLPRAKGVKLSATSCADERTGDVLTNLNFLPLSEEEGPRFQPFSFTAVLSAPGQSWLALEYFCISKVLNMLIHCPWGGGRPL